MPPAPARCRPAPPAASVQCSGGAPARSGPPAAQPPAPTAAPQICGVLSSVGLSVFHRRSSFSLSIGAIALFLGAAQQVLLNVPELIGQVHVVLVGVVETLHLVPQGVYLLTAVFADLRQRRAVVYPLAVQKHRHQQLAGLEIVDALFFHVASGSKMVRSLVSSTVSSWRAM